MIFSVYEFRAVRFLRETFSVEVNGPIRRFFSEVYLQDKT
jgi:hypothetical protein